MHLTCHSRIVYQDGMLVQYVCEVLQHLITFYPMLFGDLNRKEIQGRGTWDIHTHTHTHTYIYIYI